MKIFLLDISVRDLVAGYVDNGEGGVVGYGGMLNIRPPYQREFIYKDRQRNAVIDTIQKGFPLNVMYWSDRVDGTYEVIDGQQRTVSVAQYISGDFSVDGLYFHNLPADRMDQILDYELMIYACSGTDSEKLEWFRIVNIAGEKLTDQELRNAVYAGPWLSDAKRYFSRTGGPAHSKGGDYLKGKAIRQEYLETAIRWASNDRIEEYMGQRQRDEDAKDLWRHFESVIDWVESVFQTKRREMQNVDWGPLFDGYRSNSYDPAHMEKEVVRLLLDDDVIKKSGIYSYLITGDEKHLHIRSFTDGIKRQVYEGQEGKCATCGKVFDISEMEADHIDPWSTGGHTTVENCQVLCKSCNRRKSNK